MPRINHRPGRIVSTGFVLALTLSTVPLPAMAGLTGPGAFTYQIPGYPAHGAPLTAELQALQNITAVGDPGPVAAYANPALLAGAGRRTDVTLTVTNDSDGVALHPAVIAHSRGRGRVGVGAAFVGHRVNAQAPPFHYQDEYGATGISSSNYGYTDIHSEGSRNWLAAGVGVALGQRLKAGAALGYLFGSLTKTATLTQYNDSTFSGAPLGTYTQTDERSYASVAGVLSVVWSPTARTALGARFATPMSEAPQNQSTVVDGGGTPVFSGAETGIEDHTVGSDAEFGLGVEHRWAGGSRTLAQFGFHDNVYLGSSASWENWEFRTAHAFSAGPRRWRAGAHFVSPYIDGGNKPLVGDSSGDAGSLGLSLGTTFGISRPWDAALTLRRVSFSGESYLITTLAAGTRF